MLKRASIGLPGVNGSPLPPACIQANVLPGRSRVARGEGVQCSLLCWWMSWLIKPERPAPTTAATGTADEGVATARDRSMGNAISADGASTGFAGRQRTL